MMVVMNWRERTYVVFDGAPETDFSAKNCMAFVPGHIVFATAVSEPPNDRVLVVYTLRSIVSRWRPVEDLVHNTDLPAYDLRIRPETIVPIIVERLEHNKRAFRESRGRGPYIRMMLHANPIRHHAHKLMVYASVTNRTLTDAFRQSFAAGERPAQGTVLFTYALNFANGGLSWTRISASSIVADVIYSPLSYAGYAILRRAASNEATTKIVDPRLTQRKWTGQTMREVMVVSKGPVSASISSNGVLLIMNQDGIKVSFYA
ncbi:hypothetical protein MSAN_01310400 [Mycena sanguinolenta]|uniref:Uncharacterized protein n=1 Tax=Mycena sanguinolenta TaxID=230812 RepID=A0A8H6YCE8_9AGAR|nr:hypothetical protein MSAN_01310400 [Mycena sanguinolenta]